MIGIQKYIFFSIFECDKHPDVPLMSIKACTEDFIRSTQIKFTIFRLCGIMQAIIGNYAIPILEQRSVFGTTDGTRTTYMDKQDIARITLAALRRPETNGKTLNLAGPKAWTTEEVIDLCEKFSEGSKAKVIKVPVWLLNATRKFLSCFQWARDASDRLAFTDIVKKNSVIAADMDETYELLGLNPSNTLTLDTYLGDYYNKIIK